MLCDVTIIYVRFSKQYTVALHDRFKLNRSLNDMIMSNCIQKPGLLQIIPEFRLFFGLCRACEIEHREIQHTEAENWSVLKLSSHDSLPHGRLCNLFLAFKIFMEGNSLLDTPLYVCVYVCMYVCIKPTSIESLKSVELTTQRNH